MSLAWDAEENREITHGRYRIYLCPSMGRAGEDRGNNLTTYVGIAGLGADAARLPVKDKRCGFFGFDRSITFGDVKDGLACTIAATETSAMGPWAAGGRSTVRAVDPTEQPYVDETGPFGRIHGERWHWRLSRRVNSNVLMADGSVRAMSDSVSPQVLEALSTIAGGEAVENDF